MIDKITHWITSHKAQIAQAVNEFSLSLTVGMGTVFTFQDLFNWFLHTIGACISALIVSAFVYFIMRKIKKMFP